MVDMESAAPVNHPLAPSLSKEGNPVESIFTRGPLYTRPRLSTREFDFKAARRVGFWPLLGFNWGSFALKNQFVFGPQKC